MGTFQGNWNQSSLFIDVSVEEQTELRVDVTETSSIDVDIKDVVYIKGSGGDYDFYTGKYKVTPSNQNQILKTQDKVMRDNVTVSKIPTYEVSNEFGTTFVIGV